MNPATVVGVYGIGGTACFECGAHLSFVWTAAYQASDRTLFTREFCSDHRPEIGDIAL